MSDTPGPPETVVDALKASQLREVLQQYGEALRARRKGIDKLNVYPVPDGDTGTNMTLTVQSVVAELKGAAADDMHSISSAISRGAVMGARGNSGAILAQVLRGVAESAKEKTSLTPHDVAEALEKARKGAYESVLKPVEGTILTVVSAAAVAARKSADEGHKLKEQMEHVRIASAEALARTPELLPVLKQAGVVDAGGSGFLLFIDALRYVATGEPIPGVTDADAGDDDGEPDLATAAHTELSDLRYEVMFLLEGEDSRIPELRTAWGEVGDSIVVVGGDGLWNCHVHSDDIGAVIEAGQDYGRMSKIRVTDLMEQVGAEHGGEAWTAEAHMHGEPAAEPVETAVVAVVSGSGMTNLYRSLGVQRVVSGGQSMNPSVADLLNAVEASNARNVVILPNNKNVIAAANQVDALTDKSVAVLPTTSAVQGMCALVAYDKDAPLESVVGEMGSAMEQVACGEVTQAVRDATTPAGPVRQGDWMGIAAEGISVVAGSLSEALCGLVETLSGDDSELLTLIEGDGATAEATDALRAWVAEHRPGLEVEVQQGGQPLYPYLVGVE